MSESTPSPAGSSQQRQEEVERHRQPQHSGSGSISDRPADGIGGVNKNKLSVLFAKAGLDAPTLMTMFKGSLPPIIGIAIYQSAGISSVLQTVGYLTPIVSILGLAILPRGKYLQNLVLNLVATCFASAVCLLMLWSSIKAREHTSDMTSIPSIVAATGRTPYNSSQSAVCAVWLFANIWFVNLLRAKMPSFNIPVILYSILTNISATFGPMMVSTAQAEAFLRELLIAILLGLALATGVSLFVIPISSRRVVFAQATSALSLFQKTIALQKEYLQGLEKEDVFDIGCQPASVSKGYASKRGRSSTNTTDGPAKEPYMTKEQRSAQALREVIGQIRELAGKMHGDIKFAKREIAWGKLEAHDLGELSSLLRSISIPLFGIATIMDIFERIVEARGWNVARGPAPNADPEKDKGKRAWNEVMKQLHVPFEILSEAIGQGLEHAGLILELLPAPKASGSDADVEAGLKPGDDGFAALLDDKLRILNSRKRESLRSWALENGLYGDSKLSHFGTDDEHHHRGQVQLFILLYMEQLMQAAGEAVQKLVVFADRKVEDGTMKKNRLLIPSGRRLRKWVVGILKDQDSTAEESPDVLERGANVVHWGDGYGRKRDPEHLPAANSWQRFGDGIRNVSKLVGSEESFFGFRVACATLTVGIIGFLEQTQDFFQKQRLVWAMIIIAMGMTQTSGQSIFGFFCRVGGTALAMAFSYVCWYIVDQKTPGVILFLWLFIFIGYYFLVKYPRFTPAAMISLVTQVLIIGYELQVRRIGAAAAERTGQPFYPTYELAPYRLATVAGGCLVAFFWTIFPSPVTDRAWMRRDLGATMYLLANYFSVINTAMKALISDASGGDIRVETSPTHKLHKVRQKIYGKLTLLLPSLKTHADFQKWEPDVGGKFPRELYEDIISRSTRIMTYLTLMSYILTREPREHQSPPDPEWLRALGHVVEGISPAHHAILSTLTLLSNSLLSGQSLPVLPPLPRPSEMARQLLPRDGNGAGQALLATWDNQDTQESSIGIQIPDILDARNMEQKGYAEFVVLQVCGTLIASDIDGLVESVGSLVGVVDFSFTVDMSDSSVESLSKISRGEFEAPIKGDKND